MTDLIALISALTALAGVVPAILLAVRGLRRSAAGDVVDLHQQEEIDRLQARERECLARLTALERLVRGDSTPPGQRPAT